MPAGIHALSSPAGKRIDIPNRRRSARLFQFHVQHLVEITIGKPAVIANADERPAHQPVHRRGIEILFQKVHVGVMPALALQIFLKAVNGHICDGKKLVELDAKMFTQLLFVVGFELRLWRG